MWKINVISVSSREQVKVEPDIAEIIYSVYSQASDAPTCQTQNNSDLDKVLTMLKEQGWRKNQSRHPIME